MTSRKASKKKPARRASKPAAKGDTRSKIASDSGPAAPAFGRLISSANAIFEQAKALGARAQILGDRLFFPVDPKPVGEGVISVGAVATLALTLDEIDGHLAMLSDHIARLETLA